MIPGRCYPILLLLLGLMARSQAHAQPGAYNYALAVEIDSMAALDQKWRLQLQHFTHSNIGDTALENRLRRSLEQTVQDNSMALRRIFDRYGYPGYREIGSSGTEHLWWLIQHADMDPNLQKRALALVREQQLRGNASPFHYAFLQDRVLVNAGEKQWYGTQMVLNSDSTSFEPRPVFEPARLNVRRTALGLGPIDEYIELMNRRHPELLRRRSGNSE
jgi:hypothetical protein